MTISIRAARREDFSAIAELLIQLYEVELPGALSGPHDRLKQLLIFSLEAKNSQGLRGRYVACSATGDILATAAMERPDEPPYERAPDGTISRSLALIGYRSTARLLMTVAQSMLGVRRPQTPEAVYFHSVVVDTRHRGQGIGHTLMTAIEQHAAADGYPAACLQVLTSNQAARRLYKQRGYEDIWSSPPWTHMLTWPSYLMRKSL